LARELLFSAIMRYSTLMSIVLSSAVLAACGGSNEPAQSPDAERSAEKANDAADRAADKADRAADKADDAASNATKAETGAETTK
jgi:hypothetical protein